MSLESLFMSELWKKSSYSLNWSWNNSHDQLSYVVLFSLNEFDKNNEFQWIMVDVNIP